MYQCARAGNACGTKSSPDVPHGWQRNSRASVIQPPAHSPNRSMSVVGAVDFSSFISQTNMYFIAKNQGTTFYTMQRTTLQDANPASDIIAAAEKLF